MNYLVTGCAGFIGSSLVDRLLADGHSVTGIDNFSTGQRAFLTNAMVSPRFRLVEGDILDRSSLHRAMEGAGFVFHLAANADVRFGTHHPRRDLEQNTIATFEVLDAMRECGVRRIGFSSTGSVYGDLPQIPMPETGPFPVQTSLYGASKLAGEGLISAYCAGFGFDGLIFRFVSILGPRYTHGHVFDFFRQLRADPNKLKVLGDGRQRKSYLHVDDCVDAIVLAADDVSQEGRTRIFNLGVDGYCELNDSIGWICEAMGVSPALEYSGGERGWIGDNPFIYLDTARIRSLGWKPRHDIREGVISTVQFLQSNPWVTEVRT